MFFVLQKIPIYLHEKTGKIGNFITFRGEDDSQSRWPCGRGLGGAHGSHLRGPLLAPLMTPFTYKKPLTQNAYTNFRLYFSRHRAATIQSQSLGPRTLSGRDPSP